MDTVPEETSTRQEINGDSSHVHPPGEFSANHPSQPQTKFRPRTCRICLEEVHPTLGVPDSTIPTILHPFPKVRWISEDSSSGRLIRPCHCRGSQKYVHEGCLQLWRHADPAYQKQQNFWECPTCKFRYRLERMAWSRLITSTSARIGITFTIMLTTIFVFGFIADPIINIYTNPLDTIVSISTEGTAALQPDHKISSWTVHFLKGFASLGVVGITKDVFLAWQWVFRGFGLRIGRRRGPSPQDILSDIPWTVVIAGALTFLTVSFPDIFTLMRLIQKAVWRFVQAWTNSLLEKAGERVADVQGGDDEIESVEIPPGSPKSE